MKFYDTSELVDEMMKSPSSRGRGLKYILDTAEKVKGSRPLHEGVD